MANNAMDRLSFVAGNGMPETPRELAALRDAVRAADPALKFYREDGRWVCQFPARDGKAEEIAADREEHVYYYAAMAVLGWSW